MRFSRLGPDSLSPWICAWAGGGQTDNSSDIFVNFIFYIGFSIASMELEGVHTNIPMGTLSTCDSPGGIGKHRPISYFAHWRVGGSN